MARRIPHFLALVVVGALLLLGQARADPTTWAVDITDAGYRPSSITIAPGDTLLWRNVGTRVHSSTSDSGVWDSGPIAPGGTYSRLFADAQAIYRYHSTFDGPSFRGEVVVQVATPTPVPSGTPGPTPTQGNLCFPGGEQAVVVPVLGLYIWVDGVWQESNGYPGLQREETPCPDGRVIPPDTRLV